MGGKCVCTKYMHKVYAIYDDDDILQTAIHDKILNDTICYDVFQEKHEL